MASFAAAGITPAAQAVVLVSPISYLTAYPLLRAKKIFFRLAGCLVVGINVFIAASVLILVEATRLHEAWGCYPQGMPASEWDYGLCGTEGFWYPPLSPVCRRFGNTAGCTGDQHPFAFFGDALALAVHGLLLASIVWGAAGVTLLFEYDPRQQTAGKAQNTAATDTNLDNNQRRTAAAAAAPFLDFF
jgi:hypothetical protein